MSPHADPETLLRQDAWLRDLATRLVRSPDQADDLVQDAWVAGLAKGRAGETDRGWLAGILRNRRSEEARRDIRQRDRRAGRAQLEATEAPGTHEMVVDLETRELVARALRELKEPLRKTLYARYVTGLSTRATAQQEGVTPGTIREREARGLEALRRRLDDDHAGDRGAWVSALLPLTAPVATGKLAGGVGFVGAAGIFLGLAIAATVAWTALGEPSHESTDPAPVESASIVDREQPLSTGTPSVLAAPKSPESIRSTEAPDGESTGASAGAQSIEAPAAKPAPSLAVDTSFEVEFASPYFMVFPPGEEHVALVFADGKKVAPVEAEPYSGKFRFLGEGTPPARIEVTDPRANAWTSEPIRGQAPVRAKLTGSAAVEFIYRSPDGSLGPEFQIDVEFLSAQSSMSRWPVGSDAVALKDGVLEGIVPGDYLFTLTAGDSMGLAEVMGLEPGETRRVEFTLGPPPRVRGLVMRGPRGPAAGVRVDLLRPTPKGDHSMRDILPPDGYASHPSMYRHHIASVTTDDEGRFELTLDRRGRFLMRVGGPGSPQRETRPFDIDLGETRDGLLITLPLRTSIEARIAFPAGISPAGWTVDLCQNGQSTTRQLGSKRAPVDKEGRFEIPVIEPGKGSLYLFEPGANYGWDMAGMPVGGELLTDFDALSGETLRLDLPFPGAVPLPVTLTLSIEPTPGETDAGLQGPAGVSVKLNPVDGKGKQTPLDPKGVALVRPGKYRLAVHGDGWVYRRTEEVVVGNDQPLNLLVHVQAIDREPFPAPRGR